MTWTNALSMEHQKSHCRLNLYSVVVSNNFMEMKTSILRTEDLTKELDWDLLPVSNGFHEYVWIVPHSHCCFVATMSALEVRGITKEAS